MSNSTGSDRRRAALYVRVSTLDQARHGTSVGAQVARLTKHADQVGWDVAGVFADEGVSGGQKSRPALDQLRRAVEDDDVDVVAVTKLDRMGRSLRDLLELVDDFLAAGVTVVSLDDSLDLGTPAGLAAFRMRGVFAEFERDMIAERVAEGQARRGEQGYWPGGNPPYGYTTSPAPDGNGRVGEIVADEAAAIRLIYRSLVVNGLTTGQTAKVLNEAGITPRRSDRFRRRMVLNVCRHTRVWAGRYTFGEWTIDVPPILDEVEADAIDAAIAKRRLGPRKNYHDYLLGSRITSPHGETMHGYSSHGTRQYRCNHTWSQTRPEDLDRCDCTAVNAAAAETIVWDGVVDLLSDPDILTRIAGEYEAARTGVAGAERETLIELESRIVALERQAADEYQEAIDDGFDASLARRMISGRRDEIAELKSHRRDVKRIRAKNLEAGGVAGRLRMLAEHAGASLDEADHDVKARIVDLLDLHVRVTGFETCGRCKGKGRLVKPPREDGRPHPKGKALMSCPDCLHLRRRPSFVISGTVPEALLADGADVVPLQGGGAVPFEVDVA